MQNQAKERGFTLQLGTIQSSIVHEIHEGKSSPASDSSASHLPVPKESITIENIEKNAWLVIDAIDPGLTIFRFVQSITNANALILDPNLSKLQVGLIVSGNPGAAAACILTAGLYTLMQAANTATGKDPLETLQKIFNFDGQSAEEAQKKLTLLQNQIIDFYHRSAKLKEKYEVPTLQFIKDPASSENMTVGISLKEKPPKEPKKLTPWQFIKNSWESSKNFFSPIVLSTYIGALFYWLSWGLFSIILKNVTDFVIPGNPVISTILALVIPLSYVAVNLSKRIFIWSENRFDFSESTFWKNNIRPFFDNRSWRDKGKSLGLKVILWPFVMVLMPLFASLARIGLIGTDAQEEKNADASAREAMLAIAAELITLQEHQILAPQDNANEELTGWYPAPKERTTLEIINFGIVNFINTLVLLEYVAMYVLVVLIYTHAMHSNFADLFYGHMLSAAIPLLVCSALWAVLETIKYRQEKNDYIKEESGPYVYVLDTMVELQRNAGLPEYHDSYVILTEHRGRILHHVDSSGAITPVENGMAFLDQALDNSLGNATRGVPIQQQSAQLQQQILPKVWNRIHKTDPAATHEIFFKQRHRQRVADRAIPEPVAEVAEESTMITFFQNPYWRGLAFLGLFFINSMFVGRMFFLKGTGISTFILGNPLFSILGSSAIVTVLAILGYTILHGLMNLYIKRQSIEDTARKQQNLSSSPSEDPTLLDSATKQSWYIKFTYLLSGSVLACACSIFALSSIPAFASLLSPTVISGISGVIIAAGLFLSYHLWTKNHIMTVHEKNTTYLLLLGLASSLTLLLSVSITSESILYLAAPIFLVAAILFATTFIAGGTDVTRAKNFWLEKSEQIKSILSPDLSDDFSSTEEQSLLLQGKDKEIMIHAIALLLLALGPDHSNYKKLERFMQRVENEEPLTKEKQTELYAMMEAQNNAHTVTESPAPESATEKKNKKHFLETFSFVFLIILACLIVYIPSAFSTSLALKWSGFAIIALCTVPRLFVELLVAQGFLAKENALNTFLAKYSSVKALTAIILTMLLAAFLASSILLPMLTYAIIPWPLTILAPLLLAQATLKYLTLILDVKMPALLSRFFLGLDVVILSVIATAPLLIALAVLSGILTVPATLGVILVVSTLPAWFLIFKVLLPNALIALNTDQGDSIESIEKNKENIETYCKRAGYITSLTTLAILIFATGYSPSLIVASATWAIGLAVGTFGSWRSEGELAARLPAKQASVVKTEISPLQQDTSRMLVEVLHGVPQQHASDKSKSVDVASSAPVGQGEPHLHKTFNHFLMGFGPLLSEEDVEEEKEKEKEKEKEGEGEGEGQPPQPSTNQGKT